MAIDFDSVQEIKCGRGAVRHIPSGGYVCTITSAELKTTKNGDEALVICYDILEGEFAGFFSQDFYANKPFKHNDYIVFGKSEESLGVAKGKLNRIAESNSTSFAKFDPFSPVNSGHPELFVGKHVGLVLQERLCTYNGRDQHEVKVAWYENVADIKAGKFKVPETIDDRVKQQATAQGAGQAGAGIYDEEIPF